jgi:hypothetical protein
VTCTGAGGTATGTSAKVTVGLQATAEGLWQGLGNGNGTDRAISGVVTKENEYWLVYNAPNNSPHAAGFYAGQGTSLPDATGLAGSFPSSNLREFNFEGAGPAGGSLLNGAYVGKSQSNAAFNGTAVSTSLSSTHSLNGTQAYEIEGVTTPMPDGLGGVLTQNPNPATFTDGGTAWIINPVAGAAALAGSFVFAPYDVSVDLSAATLGEVALSIPNRTLTFSNGTAAYDSATRKLTLTGINFTETSPGVTCAQDGVPDGPYCAAVPGPANPSRGSIEITFDPNMIDYTGVATVYQAVPILSPLETGVCWAEGGVPGTDDACAINTLTFAGTLPNTPSVTQSFVSTYNAAYDLAPSLSDIAGSYAGSAGIDTTINGSATFDIAADGSVTGLETTGCTYLGNVTTHASGGNVYDVALTFTPGGTCTYTGAFTGVATYDATTSAITVTAVNANKDQGFLFSGTKVP